MNRANVIQDVASLMKQTNHDHHEAFAATGGADPDWAIWYASAMKDRFNDVLGTSLTQSELIAMLMAFDQEHVARGGDTPWPTFYAELAAERYLGDAQESLALYHFEGCPFCMLVRRTIDELGIEVELRDVRHSTEFRDELLEARGRGTVPVLRCTSSDGTVRWMPESRDIVRYLRERHGTSA